MSIPDEAVEAVARALVPAAWGPQVWQFAGHGETPTDARNRVQKQALTDARRALEAASEYVRFERKMCPFYGGSGLADPEEVDQETACPTCSGSGFAHN